MYQDKYDLTCPKCGSQLYLIEGLHLDRDGIRRSWYCNTCKRVFATHASHLVTHAMLSSDMTTPRNLRILLERMLQTLKEMEEAKKEINE
jgi:ribosomal protein L37AE/L43A